MISLPYLPRSHAGFYDSSTHRQRPVFGIDVDGTLGEYHEHFATFAEGWAGKAVGRDEPYDGTVPFWKWLGLSKTTYRKIKLAYRQGGLKRSMPMYPYASELTRAVRKAGAVVVICTTRPYLQLDNLEPDTQHCLRRNGIQYDAIISGEHKYRDLKFAFGSRVQCVLEDDPAMVKQASDCGFFTYLMSKAYNMPPALDGRENDFRYERVHDLEEACANMLTWTEGDQ